MIGAAERELGEADVGIGGNGGLEVVNVKRGADNGGGEASCLVDLVC